MVIVSPKANANLVSAEGGKILTLDMKKTELYLTAPLAEHVSSPASLYLFLIPSNALNVAERVREMDRGKTITQEILARSVRNIPTDIEPVTYISWLKDVVIPSLSINHPALQSIKVWLCQVADKLAVHTENEEYGLDSAISLLQVRGFHISFSFWIFCSSVAYLHDLLFFE